MKQKYGEFTNSQFDEAKQSLRGSIFFLLLCVDPNTSYQYPNIDVSKCFTGLQLRISGMNELLLYKPEVIDIMSLLEAARQEYESENFDFQIYRKLILDAGATVLKIKDGD